MPPRHIDIESGGKRAAKSPARTTDSELVLRSVGRATHKLDYGKQSVRAISAAKLNHDKSAEIAKHRLIYCPSIRLPCPPRGARRAGGDFASLPTKGAAPKSITLPS